MTARSASASMGSPIAWRTARGQSCMNPVKVPGECPYAKVNLEDPSECLVSDQLPPVCACLCFISSAVMPASCC